MTVTVPAPLDWPSADCNDIALADPAVITLQGTLVVFAREAGKEVDTLYYNVRATEAASGDPHEWIGWNKLALTDQGAGPGAPRPADDRAQLRLGGMDLITVDSLATTPAPADAPFRVVTDGRYVCCFRQSTSGSLYLDRFILVQVPQQRASGTGEGERQDSRRLERAWEVRYRRSERRDVAAGPGDSLGSRNMVGEPFVEPTIELTALSGITDGRFDVLLAPTSDPELMRWHVVAVTGDRLTFLSCPQSRNGGIDLDPELARSFTVTPALRMADRSVPLRPSAGVGISTYAEQEQATAASGEPTSLRRAMRLAAAVPVTGAWAQPAAALAVYDFTVLPDGTIPAPAAGTDCVLVDGTLNGDAFVPAPDGTSHPVPAEAVHPAGAGTVGAVLLGTPSPVATPALLDGSDGLVHCYFPQSATGGAFSVAQYDPTVTPARVALPWKAGDGRQGTLELVARRSGSSLAGLSVTVADCVRGDAAQGQVTAPELCDVTIDYGSGSGLPAEHWGGVPRDLLNMIAVLNGGSSQDPADEEVQSGRRPFYDLSGELPMVRLPMSSDAAVPPRLDLVSHRPDVPLARAVVDHVTDETANLTLHFTLPRSGTVVQTWAAVPVDTAYLTPILAGDAAPASYPYRPAEQDTPVYALSTSGGTILLFGAAPGSLEVSVTTATDQNPEHCDVKVTAAGSVTELTGVSRKQSAFVAALSSGRAAALFSYVSPDPAGGSVADQRIDRPLDLRGGSLLFEVLKPVPGGKLAAGAAAAANWQGRSTSDRPPLPASVTPGRGMLALAAVPPGLPLFGQDPWVLDVTGAPSTGGANGTWLAAHVPTAPAFGGNDAMVVPNPGNRPAPARTWTIESWVLPNDGRPSAVVVYDNGQATGPGELTPSYFLGTVGRPSLRFSNFTPSGSGKDQGSYLGMAANALFAPSAPGFTWEAWIRPDAAPCPVDDVTRLGCVMQVYEEQSPTLPLVQLGLDVNRYPTFAYHQRSSVYSRNDLKADTPIPEDVWSHVAVTGSPTVSAAGTTWTLRIHVNAQPAGTAANVLLYNPPPKSTLAATIGGAIAPSVSLFGAVSELRLWNFARSRAELRQTMETALSGDEPGLTGFWPLDEDRIPDSGVFPNQAAATQQAALDARLRPGSRQGVHSEPDNPLLRMVTAVGGSQPVLARSFLRAGEWSHLAVAYEAAGALALNRQGQATDPLAYGVCSASGSFWFENEFTVEAWVATAEATDAEQTVLAQWGPRSDDQSFRFGVTADGHPFCTVRVHPNGHAETALTVAHPGSIIGPGLTHLAATLSSEQTTDGKWVTCTLTMWVNATRTNETRKTFAGMLPVTSVQSAAPVTVGVAVPPSSAAAVALESQAAFVGTLTGVRLWSVALDTTGVPNAMRRHEAADHDKGVVMAWWFTEGTGAVARDSAGGNDLVLTDTDLWSALQAIGTYTCYCNGRPVTAGPASDEDAAPFHGIPQFTVGACRTANDGRFTSGLTGALAELRLWRAALSHSQITDAMYRRLAGDEPGLVAYWSLDGNFKDLTGQGLDGEFARPNPFVPSLAPVADEGPQVHNVYQGPVTRSQRPLTGRPAVADYPELETRWDGTPYAVMRRAYVSTEPAIELSTGYGLGEMGLVYMGQVQTNPTLIGYIEGAPPVPSENLSRPLYDSPFGYNSYQDASTVTLRSEEATSFTFTSSDYRTFLKMDLHGKFGYAIAGENEVNLIVGNAQTAKWSAALGGQFKSNLEIANQKDESYLSEWTRAFTDTLGLRGMWEAQQSQRSDYLDPLVGRRYQPLNVGYALVESLTADLYAMRLHSTGAMVGKVVYPNLEIPPDRNVITFRIDPRYVKNGTLDGKVGLSNDPDYPEADLSRGSYFKPAEAFRLAAAVERSDEALRTFYQQFNAQSRGRSGPDSPDLGDAADDQFYDFGRDIPVRGIANRYVWTATGGLHTETEQFSAAHERTYSGFYDWTVTGGVAWEGRATTPKVGLFSSLDLLFGGHFKIQVGKKENERRSLSLTVTAAGETMLQAYDEGTGYTAYPCPGKVDAYRFMTFYLPPSDANGQAFLNQVVDPEWLKSSSDPNAIALRGVQFTGHGAWRVLHRVTYVSRVPPKFDTNPDQNVAREPERVIEVTDNPLLIQLVEEALSRQKHLPGQDFTPAEIGAAVATVLAPVDGTDSVLGTVVPWWRAFLAAARTSSPPQQEKVELLDRILRDAVTYFQAGFSSGVLPRRPL